MNLSFGYYGNPTIGPAIQNPLTAQPSTRISLTQAEINRVTNTMGLPNNFHSLNPSQQKVVAARILQNRGDPVSLAQSANVVQSNPAYQTFQVVSSLSGIAALLTA
jgi:hypothetical protein